VRGGREKRTTEESRRPWKWVLGLCNHGVFLGPEGDQQEETKKLSEKKEKLRKSLREKSHKTRKQNE